MADLPPPYCPSNPQHPAFAEAHFSDSHQYVGHIRNASSEVPQRVNMLSTGEFWHQHDMYIAAITFRDGSGTHRSVNTMYFWPPDSTSPKFVRIKEDVMPDVLKMIRGFRECGIWRFTGGDDVDEMRKWTGEQIVWQLLDTTNSGVGNIEVSSVAKIGDEIPVSVYRIHVFSRNAKGISGDETSLLFRWAKPLSPYHQNGTWKPSLIGAIEDGTRLAGKELMLLVREVED